MRSFFDSYFTPPRTSPVRGRALDSLTAVRGIAAWWVVFYHLRSYLIPHWPSASWLFESGYLAVDFFFVLSGFVIHYSSRERLTTAPQALGDFWLRRFARVYPLHFVMLLAFVPIAILEGLGSGWSSLGDRYGVKTFILSLFLVQNWGFTMGMPWNYPSWSISTEAMAYLLFPLVLLGLKVRQISLAALAMLALGALALLIAPYLLLDVALGQKVGELGALRCVSQFMIGVCVAELFMRTQGRVPTAVATGCLWGGVVLLAGYFLLPVRDVFVLPLAWPLLVFGLATRGWGMQRLLTTRALVYVGDTSYAVYLSHAFLFILFKLTVVQVEGQASVGQLAGLVAGIFIVSVFLYHKVERPAQLWVLARGRQWLDRRALVAAKAGESR